MKDPTRLEAFAAQVVSDLAAAMGSAMTNLGGKRLRVAAETPFNLVIEARP